MSIKKELFTALQTQLKTYVPNLKWVDKNMGQLKALDQFEIFPMPAILMEYGRIEWQTIGNSVKQGNAPVKLTIIYENYSAGNSETTEQERNIAFEFFDFCEAVKQAVEDFAGENFGRMTFVADDEDNDHENFIVTTQEYNVMLTDDSTAKNRNYVPVDPEITAKYKRPVDRPESNVVSDFIIPGKG